MKFKVISKETGFTVELAETKSEKRLEIKNLELEEPFLCTVESITSEIKNRASKYFDCDEAELITDDEAERKFYRTILSNKQSFESD